MAQRSIKLLSFDLDNTLWDVTPSLIAAEQAQREWLQRHRPRALNNSDINALRKTIIKQQPELLHDVSHFRKSLIAALQSNAGYSVEDVQSGTQEAFAVFLAQRQRVTLFPGVLDILENLAKTYRIAGLTNGNADIDKTEAGPIFEFCLRAEDIGISKPDNAAFTKLLERAELEPDQIIHIGDSANDDVLGAQQSGIKAIWVNLTDQDWEKVGNSGPRADVEINHLDELEAAVKSLSG